MTNKLSIGKITKDIEEATITFCDNGFFVSMSGRDDEENWQTAKFVCSDLNEAAILLVDARSIRQGD